MACSICCKEGHNKATCPNKKREESTKKDKDEKDVNKDKDEKDVKPSTKKEVKTSDDGVEDTINSSEIKPCEAEGIKPPTPKKGSKKTRSSPTPKKESTKTKPPKKIKPLKYEESEPQEPKPQEPEPQEIEEPEVLTPFINGARGVCYSNRYLVDIEKVNQEKDEEEKEQKMNEKAVKALYSKIEELIKDIRNQVSILEASIALHKLTLYFFKK